MRPRYKNHQHGAFNCARFEACLGIFRLFFKINFLKNENGDQNSELMDATRQEMVASDLLHFSGFIGKSVFYVSAQNFQSRCVYLIHLRVNYLSELLTYQRHASTYIGTIYDTGPMLGTWEQVYPSETLHKSSISIDSKRTALQINCVHSFFIFPIPAFFRFVQVFSVNCWCHFSFAYIVDYTLMSKVYTSQSCIYLALHLPYLTSVGVY